MKQMVKIEHELLNGYIVTWDPGEGDNLVAIDDGALLVFDSIQAAEETYRGEKFTVSECIINNCLIELSSSLYKVDLSNRNHFLNVHNILDDVAINTQATFGFQSKDEILDMLNDYDEFGVDSNIMSLLFKLVGSINQYILQISKSYVLVEKD